MKILFIQYLWNSLCVFHALARARGYKTHNSFHKYHMKWKFISDPLLITWYALYVVTSSHFIIFSIRQTLHNSFYSSFALFSAPEPKAQVHYCDHALSVVRLPSVVRPSSLTFHIFDFSSETAEWNSTKLDRKQDLNVLYKVCVFRADRKNKMAALASDWWRHFRLLLWNRGTEFNETWQEARSQHPLPSLCFSGWSENKMVALACDWLRNFRLLLCNCWTEFNETVQEARSQSPLPSVCSSGPWEKQDGCPGLWLAEKFSTSLKPLNGIQRNLTGNKIWTSSTKFVFFLANQKNKMATLVSDWLRHFGLFLWNHWTACNET